MLIFLLLPAIVVAVLVLEGVTFRNSFQLEKLREQSVVEATLLLANEKADRLDKRLIEQDNAVASAIDVTNRQRFGADWLKVAARQTPTVRAVLIVDVSSSQHDVVAFASRAPGPEDEHFRRVLVNSMLTDMKLDAPPRDQLRHLHKSYQRVNYLVSYWQRDVAGRHYLVVAWHDVPRIVHDIFPSLYSDRDQQSRVNVVDGEGRIVYGPPLSRGGFTLGRHFQTTLYKWRLNVTMISAEELAAAVARRRVLEMVMVGLSGLVVVLGLIVVLVAAARERKLSNLKSDFVANVSHELKTPLSLVRMFGELLQSGRVESEAKRQQYLQIITSESERLSALIENVLDFAKVERGRAAYEFTEGSLTDVVGRAVEACRVRAERDHVALELETDEAPPCRLDERAIEIGVINLVDNALKYAAGGQRVRVEVLHGARSAEIRVTDQGPGIPPEDRKRIFERFVRGTSASGNQVRGSGIGLALVKHIAEAHGGRAWVEPAEPRGSTFVLSIRLEPPPRGSSVPGARVADHGLSAPLLVDFAVVGRGLELQQLLVRQVDGARLPGRRRRRGGGGRGGGRGRRLGRGGGLRGRRRGRGGFVRRCFVVRSGLVELIGARRRRRGRRVRRERGRRADAVEELVVVLLHLRESVALRRRQHAQAVGLQLHGVHELAVLLRDPVEVRPGRAARAADVADHLHALDVIADLQPLCEARQMRVARLDVAAVLEHHQVARRARAAQALHHAVRRSVHRRADRSADVRAQMRHDLVQDRVHAVQIERGRHVRSG